MFIKNISIFSFVLCLLALPIAAQEDDGDEFDPRAAIKKIKEDLDSIVEDFAELSAGKLSSEKGERVVENIDKLLKGMQNSQDRIVGNLDDLIQKMKSKQSKSKSSSPSSSGKQSKGSKGSKSQKGKQKRGKKRDRNQEREQGQGKPENEKGKQKGSKPEDGDDPQDSQKKDGDLRNSKDGRKAPKSGRDQTPVQIDAEGWGHLPAEVRQLLIDKNFRDYFPDYEREISDYLKSLNKRKK